LATGQVFQIPLLNELAAKYSVSPAQIAIRFTLELKTLPLPKSIHEDRIVLNTKVDFKIDDLDIEKLLQVQFERKH
jgi:diketogulonate reductase-like aldo/keto reductase